MNCEGGIAPFIPSYPLLLPPIFFPLLIKLLAHKGAGVAVGVFPSELVVALGGEGVVVEDMLPHLAIKVDVELGEGAVPVKAGALALLDILGEVPGLALVLGVEAPVFSGGVNSLPIAHEEVFVDGHFEVVVATREETGGKERQKEVCEKAFLFHNDGKSVIFCKKTIRR